MKKLTFLDQGFIEMESAENSLHVGIVQIYEPPAEQSADFLDKALKFHEKQLQCRSPFNLKLHYPETGWGRPDWQKADKLNMSYHVHKVKLPGPELHHLTDQVAKTICL